jgi:hypothetical protein
MSDDAYEEARLAIKLHESASRHGWEKVEAIDPRLVQSIRAIYPTADAAQRYMDMVFDDSLIEFRIAKAERKLAAVKVPAEARGITREIEALKAERALLQGRLVEKKSVAPAAPTVQVQQPELFNPAEGRP